MRALKALILVGGFGTRLRPLTFTLPKPLVPFANKPMIVHQIEQLVKVGVEEIVLAVNYQPEVMIEVMKKYENEFGIKISFSVEEQPLGTGGPIALAADILRQGNAPFFVLNSDIICDFPFDQLLQSHVASGATGTLLVTRVSEPSKYGVIVDKKGTNQIERFVEKPVEFISNRINAGVYVLSPKVLDMISLKPTSIEHDVFPRIAEEGELFFHDLHGFWMDVGQPKDYLIGNQLYLKHLAENNSDALHLGKGIIKNVLIHPSARIGKNCLIGPDVIIGPNVTVEDGVRIMRSTIMEHSTVKSNSLIMDSIIGWKCVIGAWCRLEGKTVLGENVHIKPELFINGAYILPHKTISTSVENPEIIM